MAPAVAVTISLAFAIAPFIAKRAISQHKLSTIAKHQFTAFDGHCFWHYDYNFIAKRQAPTADKPIPVLPDVASTIVPPGCNSPDSTAA